MIPLVGQQGLGGHLPREHVRDHQTVLVPPPRVLAEVHQVRLQPVVGPLRRALPQAPRLGRQDLPGHVAAQGRSRPRARQVTPVRELPRGDLKEFAGVLHVEVPGQLLQQPDGLLLRHVLRAHKASETARCRSSSKPTFADAALCLGIPGGE